LGYRKGIWHLKASDFSQMFSY